MPEYTWMSIGAALLVLVLAVWLRSPLFPTKAFWISYLIVLFFEVIIDGGLTKLPTPVVIYNESAISGWRFPLDIPVEDYLFGFALIVLALVLWVRTDPASKS